MVGFFLDHENFFKPDLVLLGCFGLLAKVISILLICYCCGSCRLTMTRDKLVRTDLYLRLYLLDGGMYFHVWQ